MLALRLVLTAAPPTLVFDEVDAGIGGQTARAVGTQLRALAEGRRACWPTGCGRFEDSQRTSPTASGGSLTKHIFVTGGVASSLGKGLSASSLGRLLKAA
jgi:hypothetical protein